MALLCSPVPLENRERRTWASFEVGAGEEIAFVLTHSAVAPRGAAQGRSAQCAGADRSLLEGLERTLQGRRRMVRRGVPLAHHAQGAHLRAHRRHGRRADHFAARENRRRAQLGLSLLLAARRDAHAAGDDGRRLLRRGARLARMAGARGCRQSGADPDHVRHRRRAPPAGIRASRGSRATKAPSRCASATPPRRSCSSTSTAS